jgi:hypothetical protein
LINDLSGGLGDVKMHVLFTSLRVWLRSLLPHLRCAPTLIDMCGILVVQAQPVGDLADFVQRERDQRVAELIQQCNICNIDDKHLAGGCHL